MTRQNKKPVLSSKTLKAQLLSVIAMLVVAAVALSSATYAWFVNNSTVTVETMTFQATTAQALLVAVKNAAGNVVTPYKNFVSNDDIETTAAFTTMFTDPLIPASVVLTGTAANDQAFGTFYKSNGHTSTTTGLLDEFVTADLGTTTYDVKKIPLSFMSSIDMDVYFNYTDLQNILVEAAAATVVNGADAAAQRTGIAKALRVAIVADGTVNIFQFSEDHITGANFNTDYTNLATVDGATGTDVTTLQVEATATYAGIKTLNDAKNVTEVATLNVTNTTNAAAYFPTTASTAATAQTDIAGYVNGKTPLFSLVASVPEDVTIYIWLDGVDQDCISVLSQYNFATNFSFVGAQDNG